MSRWAVFSGWGQSVTSWRFKPRAHVCRRRNNDIFFGGGVCMDIRKVKKLIELLEESGISELEISEGEESVRISRHPRGGPATVTAAAIAPAASPSVAALPATSSSEAAKLHKDEQA